MNRLLRSARGATRHTATNEDLSFSRGQAQRYAGAVMEVVGARFDGSLYDTVERV